MIEPISIGIILVVILGVGFLFSLFMKVMKIFSFLITVVVIILLVGGYFVTQDVQDFNKKWPEAKKLFIVVENDVPLTAIEGYFTDNTEPTILTGPEAVRVRHVTRVSEFESLLNDHDYVLVIDVDAFNSVDQISLGDVNMTKDEVLELVHNKTALDFLVASSDQVESTAELQGVLLGSLVTTAMIEDPFFVVRGVQKGTIILLPESLFVTMLQSIPESQIERVIKLEDSEVLE